MHDAFAMHIGKCIAYVPNHTFDEFPVFDSIFLDKIKESPVFSILEDDVSRQVILIKIKVN